MDGKRRRGTQARAKGEASARPREGQTGRSTGGEPHGERYGQLADWIGVSATGSGHADEVVGAIVGLRALGWWTSRIGELVRNRRRHSR
jgi:hypothetical protein